MRFAGVHGAATPDHRRYPWLRPEAPQPYRVLVDPDQTRRHYRRWLWWSQCSVCLRHAPVHVTLIDHGNYHLFQPLLYQSTAGLSPADIASPIRAILRNQRNTTMLLGKATRIDVADKAVLIDEKRVA